MMETILSMYVTTIPVILAGILNMLVVRKKWFRDRARPIDRGRLSGDGRPILGSNKTDLGIVTMVLCSITTHVVFGILCKNILSIGRLNQLYYYHENTPVYNLFVGMAMGLVYMSFELPNSFIKRRLGIGEGQTHGGIKGRIFLVVDQIDSLLGIIMVLAILARFDVKQYLAYLVLGGLTHFGVNLFLYKVKIRRNL